jgi:RNA polymerase sigma-70 factor, ECF subfamily
MQRTEGTGEPRPAQTVARRAGGHERLDRDVLDDLIAERLIRRYQARDLEAFRLLHDRYRSMVYGVALRRLGSHDDAEDVTQGVFYGLLGSLFAFQPEGRSFRRWLMTIARNAAEDERRRGRRSDRTAPEDLDLLEQVPAWGEATAVHEMVAQLPEAERQVLVLRYRWDLPARDIGQVLGRNEAAVWQLHSRGLAKLRAALSGC